MQQPYPAVFSRGGNTWSTRSETIGCYPSLVETLPQTIYRLYTATKMSRNLTLRLTNLEHSDSFLPGFFWKSRHYLIWVRYENCFDLRLPTVVFHLIHTCNLAKTSRDSELAGERHAWLISMKRLFYGQPIHTLCVNNWNIILEARV